MNRAGQAPIGLVLRKVRRAAVVTEIPSVNQEQLGGSRGKSKSSPFEGREKRGE